jgi:hypothetical protein
MPCSTVHVNAKHARSGSVYSMLLVVQPVLVTACVTRQGAAVTVYTHASVFIHHVLTDSAVCICKVMMSPAFVAMHTT